ncbi:MAG: hypothetical protein LBB67_05965 [Oscillospiraceae bacterium]|nr:hypothetical protein [Oscillospiraceae bacterium]
MLFAAVNVVLLFLFGTAIVIIAVKAPKLIAFENRCLIALADVIARHRTVLAEEESLIRACSAEEDAMGETPIQEVSTKVLTASSSGGKAA